MRWDAETVLKQTLLLTRRLSRISSWEAMYIRDRSSPLTPLRQEKRRLCPSIAFVHEGQSLTIGRNLRQYIELDKKNLDIAEDSYDNSSRQVPGRE